ncbi:hypothetical protein [Microbacterium sp. NPDC055357]
MHVGYIYVTRSSVDDYRYVGQSSRMDERSIATYLGSGDYFAQAVAEYGRDNFEKTILGYYDDQADLDYAEVLTIAQMRADGFTLYNGGVGGPRAQRQFVRSMFDTFGVLPQMVDEWHQTIAVNREDVMALIAAGADVSTEDFVRELEAQLLQTQDLSGTCPRCEAAAGAVCRSKTGNPTRNHVSRPVGV